MGKELLLVIAVCCCVAHAQIGDTIVLPSDMENRVPAAVVSKQLFDGDCADSSIRKLRRGPMVNGGFAPNINPVLKDEKRVANADCAGHTADGKCIRLFPKRSRTATIDDNMLSPEQSTANLYETDVHQMVKTHFNQALMQETAPYSQNAGLPGYEVINNEMNKGNTMLEASITNSLFPVGTSLMEAGDREVTESINDPMNQVPVYPTVTQPSQSSQSSSQQASTQQAATQGQNTNSGVAQQSSGQSGSSSSSSSSSSTSQSQSSQSQSSQNLETDDSQVSIGSVAVDEEPVLPPTPTPTPTTDPNVLRAQQAVKANHEMQIAACVVLFEGDGFVCAASDEDLDAKTTAWQVNVQTAAVSEPPKPSVAPFNASDVQGNLISMIAFCTKKATEQLTSAPTEDVRFAITNRSQFAQTLVRYASALSCVDSEDFPSCLSSEAVQSVQQPPVEGQWHCF